MVCSLEAQRKYSKPEINEKLKRNMNFRLAHHTKNNDENQSMKRETCLQTESENKLRDDGVVTNLKWES
ncbi:hypothetical protein TSUD_298420 [Trifolium subterraneum]|nr:hypothetical protein TSUD_298420 [Trifolium subterraneum]